MYAHGCSLLPRNRKPTSTPAPVPPTGAALPCICELIQTAWQRGTAIVERYRHPASAPFGQHLRHPDRYPQPQPERPVDRCSEPVDKLEFCSLWRVPDVLRHAVWSRVCGPSRPVRWADRLRHQVLNCLQNAPFTPLNGRILQQPASEARYLSRPRHGRSLQQSGSHCPQIVTWAPCPEPVDNHVSNRPL